jgi:hypothetical protein
MMSGSAVSSAGQLVAVLGYTPGLVYLAVMRLIQLQEPEKLSQGLNI